MRVLLVRGYSIVLRTDPNRTEHDSSGVISSSSFCPVSFQSRSNTPEHILDFLGEGSILKK